MLFLQQKYTWVPLEALSCALLMNTHNSAGSSGLSMFSAIRPFFLSSVQIDFVDYFTVVTAHALEVLSHHYF